MSAGQSTLQAGCEGQQRWLFGPECTQAAASRPERPPAGSLGHGARLLRILPAMRNQGEAREGSSRSARAGRGAGAGTTPNDGSLAQHHARPGHPLTCPRHPCHRHGPPHAAAAVAPTAAECPRAAAPLSGRCAGGRVPAAVAATVSPGASAGRQRRGSSAVRWHLQPEAVAGGPGGLLRSSQHGGPEPASRLGSAGRPGHTPERNWLYESPPRPPSFVGCGAAAVPPRPPPLPHPQALQEPAHFRRAHAAAALLEI